MADRVAVTHTEDEDYAQELVDEDAQELADDASEPVVVVVAALEEDIVVVEVVEEVAVEGEASQVAPLGGPIHYTWLTSEQKISD